MIRKILTLLAAVLAASCANRPLTVPVTAGPDELAALAGEWIGTYETRDGNNRFGDITFDLRAGSDSAVGSVVMTFRNQQPRRLDPRFHPAPFMSEQLAIKFVRIEGRRVSGEMASYTDPSCGCRLRTVFVGDVRGNRVEGTFTTYHLDSGSVMTGTWRATRRAR